MCMFLCCNTSCMTQKCIFFFYDFLLTLYTIGQLLVVFFFLYVLHIWKKHDTGIHNPPSKDSKNH